MRTVTNTTITINENESEVRFTVYEENGKYFISVTKYIGDKSQTIYYEKINNCVISIYDGKKYKHIK